LFHGYHVETSKYVILLDFTAPNAHPKAYYLFVLLPVSSYFFARLGKASTLRSGLRCVVFGLAGKGSINRSR
jgi:hypothetical protein